MRRTGKESQHKQDGVPPPRSFLVLLHRLPVGIGLRSSARLLERVSDVWAPEQDAVRDESADGEVLREVAPRVGA